MLTFGFSIRNAGPVDISLHGANRVAGEIELVGLGRPWGAPSADPTDNVILSPWLTIAPGEQVELLGVARTGSCARRLADGPDGWVMLTAIPFTYERLGIRHEVLVPLGRVVRVPADAACLDRELAGAAGGGLAAFPGDMTLRYGVSGTEPLPVLPILILGAIVVLGLIGRRVVGLRRLAAILAMIVLGVWAAVGAFMPVGVGIDATGHSLGIVDAPAGSGDTTMYVNAPPGDAFALGLVLYGQGSLPIGIEGIYDPNVPDPATIGPASSEPGHWTSAWLSDAPNGGFGDPARPFTPIVLDRVGHGIWLVGSAAGCSVGPSFDPVTPATTETVDFTLIDVRLEVSVLGWPRTISLVDTANLKLLQPTTACDGNANP